MSVKVYISSVSGNADIHKQQQRLQMVLEAKKIAAEYIDVAATQGAKERMRELMGDPKAIPPQIFNGDQYCGNYEAFDDAVEDDELEEFLKLK